MDALTQKPKITEENIQFWISQLEQWTTVFYANPNPQNVALWQEAQTKLVQFQKIHDCFELCTEIIKRSRNSLVLYQATLCLKNSIANDFKKFDTDELFKLFQFLYEFLCSQALENETSVNEMAALICAMIIKRIASEPSRNLPVEIKVSMRLTPPKDIERINQVISRLCTHIKDPNENFNKKLASALMLSSLIFECHMTNRSTLMGLRVCKHLTARKFIEVHLKMIVEACLETIDRAFSSNIMNPANQTCETQVLFHLVGALIQCVEFALSFNSTESGFVSGGERVLRVVQCRAYTLLSYASEHDNRMKAMREWSDLILSPRVVQFLFNLYATVKDVQNTITVESNDAYAEFVGNLMLGSIKIMDSEKEGIDDSFQIACLITSISMHTSETRDTITKIKAEHFIPFLEASQRFTCRVFEKVATTTIFEDEEEEEKTVDALLDFWYHLLRNIEAEIRYCKSFDPPRSPKVTEEELKAYSRVIVEKYISCHLHAPIGQVVPKPDQGCQEVDLDNADEQDDNNIHSTQLISFGMLARFDALHTAKIFLEVLTTRVEQLESLLTQCITSNVPPTAREDLEFINDDIHWLLLMLQHFLTQTGYGEVGFMCNEILAASIAYKADVNKTLEGFNKCDYKSPEVDPIVRLVLITLKLCQIEMNVCQSGKMEWLSVQTNCTLTGFMSRFCLTYLHPKESDYTVISECMNYCFGQDAPTANKFLIFIIEHTGCIVMCMKGEHQVVLKNIQLLTQINLIDGGESDIFEIAGQSSIIVKMFSEYLKLSNLTSFPPKIARAIFKLMTKIFADDWTELIQSFCDIWDSIMNSIQRQQHAQEAVVKNFLEFCDNAMGVCEACDDLTSESLFEQLLLPIVKAIPTVINAFKNFETVPVAVFDLLYHIVKYPFNNLTGFDNDMAKDFYQNCEAIVGAYHQINIGKQRNAEEEEDCEDIIGLLNFCNEVMKRDWGRTCSACESVIQFSIDKLSSIMKPEHMGFPRIRALYYRLLVYLVDEEDRLKCLSDNLLNTIVSCIILTLQSQYDRDTDNHIYTIISISCRMIYQEKGKPHSDRVAKFMLPVLPALFQATISQGSFTINTDTAELIAPAMFSLRCCFLQQYHQLVNELIDKQDDPYIQTEIKNLFEGLESKISKLTLNRASCREFSSLFVPFLAELHSYVTIR